MKRINSIDELIEYTSSILSKDIDFQPVDIVANKITFDIKINGDDWSKLVDIRHAKYITSLQECVNDLLEDFCDKEIDEDLKIVKVDIQEGSSIMLPDITEIIKSVVTPMTPESTFISVVLAILSFTGFFAWKRWVDYKQDESGLLEHEKTKRTMMDVIIAERNRRDSEFSPYERPIKTLVNTLDDEDTISFPGSTEIAATKEEAKMALPKRKRSEEKTSYADGEYVLNSIDYSQGELLLFLSQDGQSIKAYTSQLSDDDAKALFDDISIRQRNEELPFSLVLQINIKHTAKKIKSGSIVGVGKIRDDKNHAKVSTLCTE